MNRFKKIAAAALLAFTAPLSLFADVIPTGMTTLATSILEAFTGPFVKTIIVIMLVGCAIAYAFNKDNEKMKRAIIVIAVAIGIICAAQNIIDLVWDASKG